MVNCIYNFPTYNYVLAHFYLLYDYITPSQSYGKGKGV